MTGKTMIPISHAAMAGPDRSRRRTMSTRTATQRKMIGAQISRAKNTPANVLSATIAVPLHSASAEAPTAVLRPSPSWILFLTARVTPARVGMDLSGFPDEDACGDVLAVA